MKCPECGCAEIVDGVVSSEQLRFVPRGLRWFSFYQPPLLAGAQFLSACLSCGLVWSHLNPTELRAIVDAKGSAKLKAALEKAAKNDA
jgi:uncharacterized Zn finger protein